MASVSPLSTSGRPRGDAPTQGGEPWRCPVCGERFPGDFAVCPRDGSPLGNASSAGDPLVGAVLAGSYRVTRLLTKGGMGRLYEAEHARLPRRFAIKVIHEIYALSEDTVARFEREARAAARIDSDYVVDVVDVIRAPDDRPCIVCELLEGQDLQARLNQKDRLPLEDAAHITYQVCRGLLAAHAVGVVHRDLKPSNVFLTRRHCGAETAKLLDFGVAKLLGDPEITRTGAVVGTPAYMAPEQARGASDVDHRVDVYGVAALLYRMLTGHAPFESDSAENSLARLLGSEQVTPVLDLAPDVPEPVAELVERGLSRDPQDRPETIAELTDSLVHLCPTVDRRFSAGTEPATPSSVSPTSPSESTVAMPRPKGRRRTAPGKAARPTYVTLSSVVALSVGLSSGSLYRSLTERFESGTATADGWFAGMLDATVSGTAAMVVAALTALCAFLALLRLAKRLPASRGKVPRDLPELTRALGRALIVGTAVLGMLELWLALGADLIFEPSAEAPGARGLRLAAATVVGLMVLITTHPSTRPIRRTTRPRAAGERARPGSAQRRQTSPTPSRNT